jgi:periodic tryptophan protein 2
MRTNYKLSNVCGAVYSGGNVLFTADDVILSPIGNRVQMIDLKNNNTSVLSIQTSHNIINMAYHKGLLFCIDALGRAYLINISNNSLIAQLTIDKNCRFASFSKCGKMIACCHGTSVSIYSIPSAFGLFGFVLLKSYTLHYDVITTLSWSSCGDYILTTSKDLTSRLYNVKSLKSKNLRDEDEKTAFIGAVLTGHKDSIIAGYFYEDCIYTISKDGSLLKYFLADVLAPHDHTRPKKHIPLSRFYFNYGPVTSASMVNGILAVGFKSGMFAIYTLNDNQLLGVLSISQSKIDTVSLNSTGEWVAFGSKKLGQLLVWEWQSESYVLKQQVYTVLIKGPCQ